MSKKLVYGRIIASLLGIMVAFFFIFAICDIVAERDFIQSAIQMVGQSEARFVNCYGSQYSRNQKDVAFLSRKRWLASVWRLFDCDESVIVYLKMDGETVTVVMFAMYIPSMRQQELWHERVSN